MRQAVVIGAAPCSDLDFLAKYPAEETVFICADGGLQTALRCEIEPDCYAGDNDSGGTPPEGVDCWILPPEKDLTDLEMAVHQALRAAPDRILLCGCMGGRQDHHMSNVFLLERLAKQGTDVLLLDDQNEIRLLQPGTHILHNTPYYPYFSLIPIDPWVRGLSISGARYPLSDRNIFRGTTLTVSNQFLDEQEVAISFRDGNLLLVRSGS